MSGLGLGEEGLGVLLHSDDRTPEINAACQITLAVAAGITAGITAGAAAVA